MIHEYSRGWWLSIEAIKILVKYDYDYNSSYQMDTKPFHIFDKTKDWDSEILQHSGQFTMKNPNYREVIFYNGGREYYQSKIPSLDYIKKINYSDWEVIKRVEFMNGQAMEGENIKPNYFDNVDLESI
jgi:hypothetical protein